jgi:inhibitor of KinA sporulation pathway (predicted exonuclease)
MIIKHIAFDLELEQPKTNHQTPDSVLEDEKIIQIGYVIYSLEPEFHIYKTNCLNINIGVPLSSFIKKLTGISDEDIANGISLNEAVEILKQDAKDFDTKRVLKQWGGGDQSALEKELGKSIGFGRSGCNIKHMYQVFAEANNINASGGLKKSLSKCGIKFEGSAHNAAADALNTAKMHYFLHKKLKKVKDD